MADMDMHVELNKHEIEDNPFDVEYMISYSSSI